MKVFQKISILTVALMLAIFIAVPAMAATIFVPTDYATVGAAVTAAADGDTILVTANTTETAQIVVDNKNVTVIGEGRPIIKAGVNTGGTGDPRGMWLVNATGALHLENVILDGDSGSGRLVHTAIRAHGPGVLNNCEIRNIKYGTYVGLGIAPYDANWTITNNIFKNIERVGVLAFGPGVTNVLVSGNTYTGKGAVDGLDYAIEFGAGAQGTISNNVITGCRGVALSDGSTSAGIYIENYFGEVVYPGQGTIPKATIVNNIVSDNYVGIAIGFEATDNSEVIAHYNYLAGNDIGVESTSTIKTANATQNWWGTSDLTTIGAYVSGDVNYSSPLAGEPGPAGPAGADGADGATGADGAVGATGAQGPIGPQGPQGLQGDPGPAGTSSWADGSGKVTTVQKVGIGTASPISTLHLTEQTANFDRGLTITEHYSGPAAALVNIKRSRGTETAPQAVANGDNAAAIHVQTHDGTSYLVPSSIMFTVDGAVSTNNVPTAMIMVTGTNTSNRPERVRITSAGNVGIGSSAPSQKLEVNGGVRLNPGDTKPACDSTTRGTMWFTQGGPGVYDYMHVCAKDNFGNYDWRSLWP